jgi:hypothetical protein
VREQVAEQLAPQWMLVGGHQLGVGDAVPRFHIR